MDGKSMSFYREFIDLGHKPNKNELIATFWVKPRKDLKTAVGAIAAESSVGTWTKPKFLPKRIEKIKARVFEIKGKVVKIAYPVELFEPNNLPEILSSIAGNIFGMKEVIGLRLLDVWIPRLIVKNFFGPKFGIKGIRKVFGVYSRPLVGTIVKPKLGLSSEQHARVAYEAWVGGCDLVKDDENLTSQKFNQFERRVKKTLKARKKAEKYTGEVKAYMPNITAGVEEAVKRARLVKSLGGRYAMIDIITLGWGAVQTIREKINGLDLIIHAHRAMHAAFTRGNFGMSMLVVAKLARMVGVDQLHTGTAGIGKMQKEDTLEVNNFLRSKWFGKKTVMPVASGGLHPGMMKKLIEVIGKDVIYQFGGGIHGHPLGTKAGAKAVREALEACLDGIDLRVYANTHKELKQAIKKWGVKH